MMLSMIGLSGQPDAERVVRVGIGISVRRERLEESTAGNMIARHVLENMIHLDSNMEPQPQLAASWSVDATRCRWTFRLREDVLFHDGTPFNADAVVANYDVERNPKFSMFQRRKAYFDPFASVKAVGSFTLEIVTKKPFAPMLRHLSLSGGWIESPASLARFPKESFTGLVGTGPFRYSRWTKKEFEIVANPDFRDGRPAIDKIIFRTVPNERDRLLLLEIGSLDAVTGLPIFELQRLRDEHSPIRIVSVPSLRVVALRFRLDKPPLSDPRVRRALNLGIDRHRIVETVLDGQGVEAQTMLSPRTFGYAPLPVTPYDPEAATELLCEAGITKPITLSFRFSPGRYPMDQEVVETVTSNFERIGVRLEPLTARKASEPYALSDWLGQRVADVTFTGWAPACGDGDWVLRPLFGSDSKPPNGANNSGYSNPKVDRLIEEGMEKFDPQARINAYQRAQRIIADDAPMAVLYASNQLVGLRPDLSGFEITPQEYLLFHHAGYQPRIASPTDSNGISKGLASP